MLTGVSTQRRIKQRRKRRDEVRLEVVRTSLAPIHRPRGWILWGWVGFPGLISKEASSSFPLSSCSGARPSAARLGVRSQVAVERESNDKPGKRKTWGQHCRPPNPGHSPPGLCLENPVLCFLEEHRTETDFVHFKALPHFHCATAHSCPNSSRLTAGDFLAMLP